MGHCLQNDLQNGLGFRGEDAPKITIIPEILKMGPRASKVDPRASKITKKSWFWRPKIYKLEPAK